ncbi:hypothetical protein [Dyadobacter sp. CY356]|uniref:hypothetical protein n=1 Tax=Dyadobacter sp. CY356 TaxID=2906442 RepID=UPI001F2C8CE6|nr:hypothetical protein [Dyadobacter sp. CY356]MCF0054596.1 hypothetical protein [Dyadobacter sp. CY356]
MDKKTIIKEQTEPQYPLSKGLAIMAGSVLAIVTALIFPLGEFLLYGFIYLAGKDEKKRDKIQI